MGSRLQPLAARLCTRGCMLHTSPALPGLPGILDDMQHVWVAISGRYCNHGFYGSHASNVSRDDGHYHIYLYLPDHRQQKQMRHRVLWQGLR